MGIEGRSFDENGSAADPRAESITESGMVGLPDEIQRLWTPHRMVYVADHHQPGQNDCPFCLAPTFDDERALIVHRGTHCYVLLNLYPYNNGHMLVCPYRHIAGYDEASAEEVAEIGELTQVTMRVLREVMGCHGFNIGMNQGQIAGAGIAAHLHQHVVPRWASDSNFFPIIAKSKSMPQLLGDLREKIAAAWPVDPGPAA